MVRIAHITDPHLPLAGVRPAELFGKRILGWLSWRLRRWRNHRPACLEKVVADVRAAAPGHVVVTGDVVNISARAEFVRARAWLAALGGPREVTFVPGNHDRYVAEAPRAGLASLMPWMTDAAADDGAAGARAAAARGRVPPAPFVRYVRNVAIIGLDSSWPAPWKEASGMVGAEQLARLAETLDDCRRKGLFRLLLIHHPPLAELASKPRKALRDADRMAEVLRHHGVEAVLFGHNHTWARAELETAGGPAFLLTAPSASMAPGRGRPAAGWQMLEITRRQGSWRLTVERRQLAADGRMITRERLELAPGRQGAAMAAAGGG